MVRRGIVSLILRLHIAAAYSYNVVADLMAVNFQSSRGEIVINISQVDVLLPHRRWQHRQIEEELQKGRG